MITVIAQFQLDCCDQLEPMVLNRVCSFAALPPVGAEIHYGKHPQTSEVPLRFTVQKHVFTVQYVIYMVCAIKLKHTTTKEARAALEPLGFELSEQQKPAETPVRWRPS